MKYSEKSRTLRSRPFLYEDTKTFNSGAHRHWEGCTTSAGFLNETGRRRLAFDAMILSKRPLGRRHVHVNP